MPAPVLRFVIVDPFRLLAQPMVQELSGSNLQMCKKSLREDQELTDLMANEIHPETVVAKATKWAMALWDRAETLEGMGRENAMHTAARWADVTPSVLWKLRYRTPREIGATVFLKLQAAHRKHIQSVEAKVAENLIALRSLPPTPARQRLVAECEGFLGIAPRAETRAAAEPARDEA